jgi:hypothetical protein
MGAEVGAGVGPSCLAHRLVQPLAGVRDTTPSG